jgi:hypothetical protein
MKWTIILGLMKCRCLTVLIALLAVAIVICFILQDASEMRDQNVVGQKRKANQPHGKAYCKQRALHELSDRHAQAQRRKDVWGLLAPASGLQKL